jgi:hypothetical protein
MISIRYADLPEGLHAQAAMKGKRTIIYLRPGLTAQQRQQSLRRAMQSARMGHGPRLPAPLVALAVAGDVAGGTLRNLGAAVRSHVLGFLLLAAGTVAAVVCYALFVTVSLRLMLPPGGGPAALPEPHHVASSPIRAHVAASPARKRGMNTGPAGTGPARTPSVQPSRTTPSPTASHATPSPSAAMTPQPSPASTGPMPSPSGPRSPSPSPSPSPSDLCLEIFHICL